jgi:hypothetical protein
MALPLCFETPEYSVYGVAGSPKPKYRVFYRAVSITTDGFGTVRLNVLVVAWHILLGGAFLFSTWVYAIHCNTASFLLDSKLCSFVLNSGFCVCHLICVDWFWYFGNLTFCVYFVHCILPSEDATWLADTCRRPLYIQGDSFGTRPKKMRISQKLFIIQFNIL